MREDLSLDIVIPAAAVLLEHGSDEERALVGERLRVVVATIAQRTFDPEIRARWFRGPVGGELVRLAGPLAGDGAKSEETSSFTPEEVALLQGLVAGRTDREIAEDLGLEEHEVTRRLGEVFARIGTSSRAEATAFAFREVV